MNDRTALPPRAQERLDRLLDASFPAPASLGDDFEDAVMARLQDPLPGRSVSRRIHLLMALYWCAAVFAGCWLLWTNQGAQTVQGSLFLHALVPTVFGSFATAWWLLRRSGLRLNELFLGTLQ